MTATTTLVRRQAAALEEAFEVLADFASTERLLETKNEPIRQPAHVVPVLVAEMVQVLKRHETALNHMANHITAGQDVEIERLRERVQDQQQHIEKLEKRLEGTKPKGKGGAKRK